MIPGPTYVYQCPNCNNLLQRESLLSGNTFNSTTYSDGKTENPMMPDFPNLTICTKCQHIFEIEELKEIGKYGYGESQLYHSKPEWEKAPYAEFLTVYEYFRVVDEIPLKSIEYELNLRIKIWHSFNDRIRSYKELYQKENDRELYKTNSKRIFELINSRYLQEKNKIEKEVQYLENINDENSFWTTERIIEMTKRLQSCLEDLNEEQSSYEMMKAEIYRNSGKFEECMEIIDNLEKPIWKSEQDWNWIKDIYRQECEDKNTEVVSLNFRVVK